jgi:hypothetical protein
VARAASTAVISPNLGLYLGQPSVTIPAQGLEDGLNFRVKRGALTSFGMGWEKLIAAGPALPGAPVTLLDIFFRTDGSQMLVAGTLTDLFEFVPGSPDKWRFLTPRYEVGTASASGTAVTGVGTLWKTGDVQVRAGDEISFGATGRRDITDTWFTVSTVNSDTSITLTASAGTVSPAAAYTIREKFQSADAKNFWVTQTVPRGDVGATIADRWYATNRGVDFIVRMAQGDTQVTRIHTAAAGGFRCKFLQRFKNMLLYLNIIENSGSTPNKPQSFKNSDVGKPETMTGGLSGEFVAGPQTAAISASLPIGDDLAIYTENEVVLCSFVGSPDIFAFRVPVSGTGLIAPRLVGQFTETHQFMGRDALYDFNGIQASAVDQQVWFKVLRQQDQNRILTSYTIFDEENGQLIWALAQASDTTIGPQFAYEASYLEDLKPGTPTPYSKRQFPFTAAGFFQRDGALKWSDLTSPWSSYNFAWGDRLLAAAFPLLLVGDAAGQVFKLGTVDTQDGAAASWFVLFGRRVIGDARHRNVIRRVFPFVRQLPSAAYSLLVTTTVYDTEGQAVGSSTVSNYSLNSGAEGLTSVKPRRRGRFAQVQFGATGGPGELHGYDTEILPGGER